jgi:hypothetical protein
MSVSPEMNAPARTEDYGQMGEAMKALPNDRWRAFVRALVADTRGYGAVTRAARAAGFGKANTKPSSLSKQAHQLSRDERIIAAIAEESRKVIRVEAVDRQARRVRHRHDSFVSVYGAPHHGAGRHSDD